MNFRTWIALFISLYIFLFQVLSIADQSTSASFTEVPFQFYFDGSNIGEVPIRIKSENYGDQLIKKLDLLAGVSGRIANNWIKRLSELAGESEWLSIELIETWGGVVAIDFSKLSFSLTVPVEFYSEKTLFFTKKSFALSNRDVLGVSKYSLIFNSDLTQRITDGAPNQLFWNTEQAARIGNVVIENEVNLEEFRDPLVFRRSTVLSYDFESTRSRIALGDVFGFSRGFMGSLDILGLGIVRDDSIIRNRSLNVIGDGQIEIERPSRVQFFVNGNMIRELNLGPGKYRLEELPIGYGYNEVEVKIQDDQNQEIEVLIPLLLSSELLKPGEQRYSHRFGVMSELSQKRREYDGSMAASGYHRWGTSNAGTLGLNYQGGNRRYLLGLESASEQLGGVLKFDMSGYFDEFDSDFAGRLRFIKDMPLSSIFSNTGLSIQYRGKDFREITRSLAASSAESRAQINLGLKGVNKWRTNFSLTAIFEGNRRSRFESSLQVLRNLNKNWRLSIGARYNKSESFEDKSLLFNLWWSGSEPTASVLTSYDSSRRRTQVNAQSSTSSSSLEATGIREENIQEYRSRIFHRTELGSLSIAASARGVNELAPTSAINFSNSFLWVPGAVSIAPIVSDSFGIVQKSPKLESSQFEVPISGEYKSLKNDEILAIYDLISYESKDIVVRKSYGSEMVELKIESFNVNPKYRSGTLFLIEPLGRLTLRGRFVYKNQIPLGLKLGKMTRSDLERGVEFFTNKDGEFEVGGIEPGVYDILLDGQMKLKLDLSEVGSGVTELGDVWLD